jgi:hypothetical protein
MKEPVSGPGPLPCSPTRESAVAAQCRHTVFLSRNRTRALASKGAVYELILIPQDQEVRVRSRAADLRVRATTVGVKLVLLAYAEVEK